jgi:DsbC/DsbD-like thiol-disulfide interchange protein
MAREDGCGIGDEIRLGAANSNSGKQEAMWKQLRARALIFSALAIIGGGLQPLSLKAEPIATAWVQGFNNQARLLAGRSDDGAGARVFAGVEIAMPPGWKTYWRTPGEAGGVPPEFDWSGSENLAAATARYPAPQRLADKSGVVVGYADRVVFPIEIAAADPTKPVLLRVKASYGVCKDLCVPAEAEMSLHVAANAGVSNDIQEALAAVPRAVPREGIDPKLEHWSLEQSSGGGRLVLEAAYPDGAVGDAFVEAPDGVYLPLPKAAGEKDGRALFEIDLSDVDVDALKHEPLTVTLVGAKGQSETQIKLK